MSHEGQKRLNKIATGLRDNELWIFGYYKTSIKDMRKYVKKEKLHYTDKMLNKTKKKRNRRKANC